MRLPLFLLFLFTTFAVCAHAETAAGTASMPLVFQSRRPLQVTGQLAPFRFLVAEVLLFERPRSYTGLKVNGIKVRTREQPQDPNGRYFQFETDAEVLNIEATTWNSIKDTFKLRPPKVTSAKWDKEQFQFTLDNNSDYATIDNVRVTVDDNKIDWHPGKKSLDPHVLVLRGEGNVPDTVIDFQLVSKTEYKERLVKKKREDKKNKNRLVASVKESWLDKVEWGHAELDLGLRFGGDSGLTLGASLAPHYAYNKTWGVRGILGVALFTGASGMALGPRLGVRVTHALSAAPVTLELGPSLYLLNKGQAFAAAIDLLGLYDLVGRLPLLTAAGLNYSFWLTPGAHVIRLVAQIKF